MSLDGPFGIERIHPQKATVTGEIHIKALHSDAVLIPIRSRVFYILVKCRYHFFKSLGRNKPCDLWAVIRSASIISAWSIIAQPGVHVFRPREPRGVGILSHPIETLADHLTDLLSLSRLVLAVADDDMQCVISTHSRWLRHSEQANDEGRRSLPLHC